MEIGSQNNNERFLTIKQVQDLMSVSRSTVWRWTADYGLKVVRVGSVVRVRESDLQVFLTRHEIGVNGADAAPHRAGESIRNG